MAKKKIRLTESQLIDLIKKSMVVEQATLTSGNGTFEKPYIDSQLTNDVDTLVDDLDGIVNAANIASMLTIIKKYVGKVAYDDTDPSAPQKVSACLRISQLYEIDESGDTLEGDINSVGTKTVGFQGVKSLQQLKTILANCMAETPTQPVQQQTQQQTQQQAQGNKFSCVESESTFKAYGNSPNQYAEVQWQGGTLSFFLDARALGDGAPANDNILYQKGTKKWTTFGECSDGSPGKQRGLILKTWTPKTN
jgi:hypothetical protein